MLERNVSPLPPGRYWIVTTSREQANDFRQWARDMAGAVEIELAEIIPTGNFPTTGHVFFIFTVPPGRAPFLNAVEFGFPNVAPPSIREHEDIRSPTDVSLDPRTDVIDPAVEAARAAANAAGNVATKAAIPLALLILLFLALSSKRRALA